KVDTSVYTRFRAGYVSGPVVRNRAPREEEPTAPRPLLLPLYNGIRRAGDDSQGPALSPLTRPDTSQTLVEAAVERTRDDDRAVRPVWLPPLPEDRKSTRLNSSHVKISYAVFCLKKKNTSRTN